MRSNGLFILFLLSASPLFAQMWNGVDTLYGNEWIKSDQSYYKIEIAEDGVFQLSYAAMLEAGLPVSQLNGSQLQLFRDGQEVPMFRSNTGSLQAGDYFEFCAKQNRAAFDRHLFQNPDQDLLNPYYSMYTDTAAYYLTWNNEAEGQSFESTANDLNNAPPKEEWFWHEAVVEYHTHAIKKTTLDGVSESIYDTGEGFARSYNNNTTTNINLQAIYESGPNSTFAVRLVSSHGVNHELKLSRNGQVVQEETWSGTQLKEYQWDVATSSLQDQEQVQVQGGTSSNDRYAVAFAKIRYPRRYDFNNADYFQFEVAGGNSDRYLEIENFDTGGGAPILYDITNQIRLTADLQGDLVRFRLPASAEMRALILVSANNIQSINKLEAVDFIDYEALSSDYIILSHSKLFDDGNGDNWVQAYANYRASVEGGNFEPLVVDVEQLYDQFGYGVARHPQAIRNFAHFMQQKWEVPPRYFFIIGKGRTYNAIRTNSQLSSEAAQNFAVPTFGRPGGDNLLLATHENSAPIYALGRLAVSDAQDIRIYLDKVKGYENLQKSTAEEDRAWRKEIIHLGGGGSPGEQATIKNQLAQMEQIIENNDFGGNVFTFTKTSSDPIQQSVSSLLTKKINSGASIITFFGHAGTGTFDVSIDDPSTYSNENKYPIVFSLGCLSGQIHSGTKSIGERFVFQEDKASIGFVATTGFGYIGPLSNFHKEFYRQLGTAQYGQGIGEVLRTCFQNTANLPGIPNRTLNQQFTLDGDPAIKINYFQEPDLAFIQESISFSPKSIDIQLDSFQINFVVANYGKANVDSLSIQISHRFPDGSEYVLKTLQIEAPKYKEQVSTFIPLFGERSIGFNKYFIEIDPNNQIQEGPTPYAEQNNELINATGGKGISVFIFSNSVNTVYPEKYAIVNSSELFLKASTANIFAPEEKYIIELDTTAKFNSLYKVRDEIIQIGGVISWKVPYPLVAGQDYYWRVSIDSTAETGYRWAESSFIYLPESEKGWNQSDFFQFRDNRFEDIELDEDTYSKKYLDDVKSIRVRNGVYPNTWPEHAFGNSPFLYIPWDNPVKGGISISVLDPVSIDYWKNQPPGDYGSHLKSSWAVDWGAFTYRTRDEDWRSRAINFLKDTIPSGHYVLVYSIQHTETDYEPQEWAEDSVSLGTNLFQIFEEQGATLIRSTAQEGAKPWAFFYKKDDPSFTPYEEVIEPNQELNHSLDIAGLWDNGIETSSRIGPAKRWDQLNWEMEAIAPDEMTQLNVYGIRSDSTRSLLISNLEVADTNISWINATEFPFLELELSSADEVNRTAPQLNYWRITYEGIPEVTLNPALHYSFQKDTLQQGQDLFMEIAIENLSDYPFDSLQVKYDIVDGATLLQSSIQNITTITPLDTVKSSFQFNSKNLSGNYDLVININPDQKQEKFAFNNVGIIPFLVQEDQRNPVLDVTFDGSYIMNGDIVSPQPLINISLKDENPYLNMSDTSHIRVFIKTPSTLDAVPVSYNHPALSYEPASANGQNQAKLSYAPKFVEDGLYELIVQAQDVSGNQSGQFDYKVTFEVIQNNSISNVLNYPNPFSTSTQFVYTLTGSQPPQDFVIQIMTVSGRVVRELTEADLGPLKIGTHRTEYAWDGTDEYGDRLANGVYLYRVVVRDENGQAYEKYENGTDTFFKNNVGKLVILR